MARQPTSKLGRSSWPQWSLSLYQKTPEPWTSRTNSAKRWDPVSGSGVFYGLDLESIEARAPCSFLIPVFWELIP